MAGPAALAIAIPAVMAIAQNARQDFNGFTPT